MTWIIFTQQEIFTLQENQLFFWNLFQISKLSIYNTEYPPPPKSFVFKFVHTATKYWQNYLNKNQNPHTKNPSKKCLFTYESILNKYNV